MASVDYFGERRNIIAEDAELNVNDYIFAQGGIFVRKIPEKEALQALESWKEIFFELKAVDEHLSKIEHLEGNSLFALQKVNYQKRLKRDELRSLLHLKKPEELQVLYDVANHVRQKTHSNASCVHGIIEFSNYCRNNCHYCGIRLDRKLPRYRLEKEEIINIAKNAVETWGFKAFVLQSGEDFSYSDEKLAEIVREVRKLGVLVFVSFGSRSKDCYQRCYDAGARAVLLRFESSNEKIFASLRPKTTLKERISLILALKKMGYVLASGFIYGLPGQSEDDILNDLELTKSLQPDMYSFGPLIPSKETPLEHARLASLDEMLKLIALARLNDANANILVTSALETLHPDAQSKALLAGANSMMINLTPLEFRKLYSIYDQRRHEKIQNDVESVTGTLKSLGRAPSDIALGPGF